jgi:hypothetical protein
MDGFSIDITTLGNDAFADDPKAEIERIVLKCLERLKRDGGDIDTQILDTNGNSVGRLYYLAEED